MTHSEVTWQEGNPYGLPGRGNGGELWEKLKTPCKICGAQSKQVLITAKGEAVIHCKNIEDGDHEE